MEYDIHKETQEAIQAGERALSSLRAAQKELSSAKNWGIFDMLGGGLISTFIKHDKMDNAQEYLERAKYDLNSFSKELRDINMSLNLNIDTHDFLNFADWFFDGLLVDWLVQDRINEAREQVDEAIRRVESVVAQLRASLDF